MMQKVHKEMIYSAIQRFFIGMTVIFTLLLISTIYNLDLSSADSEKQSFRLLVLAGLFLLSAGFGAAAWVMHKKRKHGFNVNDVSWHHMIDGD
ncbi:hypothetical protein ONV78_28910 [Hahella sp. CR1]|uniref:hypothetical protein n=1 Tax=Hahella sp. CR1 TaxID=2992807 RepID=UPI002441B058|nr:hypothetical protein [Hahella sp. CR1]MDG9671791.1 hypothetical protein [Hahella sp. CR1]